MADAKSVAIPTYRSSGSYAPKSSLFASMTSPSQNYVPAPHYKQRNRDVLGSLHDLGVNTTITDKVAILDPNLRNGIIYAAFDPKSNAIYKNRSALNQLKNVSWLNAAVEEQMIGNHEAGHALAFSLYNQAKQDSKDPLKNYLQQSFGKETEKSRYLDALADAMRSYDKDILEGATQIFARITTKDSQLRGIYETEMYKARKHIAEKLASYEDSTHDEIKELRTFDQIVGYNNIVSLKKGELENEYATMRMDFVLTERDSTYEVTLPPVYTDPLKDGEAFVIPHTSIAGGRPVIELPEKREEQTPEYPIVTKQNEPTYVSEPVSYSLPKETYVEIEEKKQEMPLEELITKPKSKEELFEETKDEDEDHADLSGSDEEE